MLKASHRMSNVSIRPDNAGIYDIPGLNVSSVLYIKGKKFDDYINELVFEDQLEQSEIDEIKLLLQYLNTSGLSSEWIVDNNNKNQDLKTLITALQTKLANIDTTTLTESSVLNNENRNSVLKTRLDTAETDIDNVETKTRFIVDASITGTGNNTLSTYRTKVGPTTEEKGSTLVELNMKNGPANELIGYTIKSNFNNDSYADNESIYSHRNGRLTLLAHTMRMQATEQIRIGNFAQYGDGGASTAINIGGRGQHVNIGCIDSLTQATVQTNIQIGQQSDTAKNTSTRLSGNMYLSDARFEDLTKTERITVASLVSGWITGYPGWILGFFSGAVSLPYSDVWVMKDASIGSSKKGDVATSNEIMVKELYVVNKDVLSLTAKVGFYLAKADYSCTQLIGNHRTQVFEGEIVLRNNNTGVNVIDWALSEANDKVNVVNIGGNDGILIHQGKSSTGTPLRIINSCNGSIKMGLEQTGTKGSAKPALEVMPYDNDGTFQTMTRIGFYPGQNQGTGKVGSYQLEVNQELDRDGIAVAQTNIITGVTVVNKINANSINTPGTITGNDVVGSTSISAPTATTTSLHINANYSGDTTNRLYKNGDNTLLWNNAISSKALTLQSGYTGTTANTLYTNADNKLYWNGAEVGAGGSSGGGGVDYYIPLANNIVNPAPNPTIQTMDEVYVSNVTKTIKQSTTATATGLFMASYRTPVFNKQSNPTISGVQTVQQWLDWSENNTIGQIYGRLYYEAAVSNNTLLYDKKYIDVVSTSYATVINGTPIDAPASLFLISFQRVIFEFVDIDVTGTSCQIKCRLEGQDLITENWNILQTSTGTKTYTSDSINQIIDFTGETFFYEQTSTTNAPIKYRVSLYVSNGGGTIRQTVAGGTDLGAYQLGSNATNDFARIRVLLYDGINQKKTVQHSIAPTLLSLDLPVSVPYNVSAFNFSRLGVELYMYQPTGAVNSNHIMTFYFNDGYISQFETSLNFPPVATPTLAQVMTSGAIASSDLSMGNFGITNVSSIQNWNVKEITAGTNISRGITNGNYTITNSAPVQDINNNGTNITVSKTSNVATITNSAPVQDINNNGTNISVSIASNVATINNTAPVQNVIAGPGIEVQINTTTKTATINNLGVSGQATRDEDNVIVDVGAEWRKPDYWLNNWAEAESSSREHQDIYVSVDGSIVVSAAGTGALMSSRDYGVSWSTTNVINVSWTAIGGTSQGSKLYAFGSDTTPPTQKIVLYTSLDYGLTWSQFTSPSFFAEISRINKVRTSGDGRYVIATDNSQPGTAAKFLYSSDSGAIFTRRSLTEPTGPSGHTHGVCISRSGATQFITLKNIRGDAQANSAVYRSFDYGATFVAVQNYITDSSSIKAYWHNIDCDATGRFVWASRYNDTSTNPWAYYSADYGATWQQASVSGIIDIVVSGSGQHIAAIRNQTNIGGGIMSSFTVFSSNYGQQFNSAQVANTLFMSIGANSDLTNVFIGSGLLSSGDGKLRVARQGRQNIQDLIVPGGTLTKVGGVYTLPNYTEELWATGTVDASTANAFPNFYFNTIDLSVYNIRYEIDCYWNLQTSVNTFISLGLNGFMNLDEIGLRDPFPSGTTLSAVSNWTNVINNGNNQDANGMEFNQTYRNRFYCGYSPIGLENTPFRYRTILNGELSLQRRPTAQAGITDTSIGERTIYNRFSCDNYCTAYDGISFTNLFGATIADYASNHQRINGTGLWAAGFNWNNNGVLSAGINRINLRLHANTEWYTYNARSALYIYRIYRVRK